MISVPAFLHSLGPKRPSEVFSVPGSHQPSEKQTKKKCFRDREVENEPLTSRIYVAQIPIFLIVSFFLSDAQAEDFFLAVGGL